MQITTEGLQRIFASEEAALTWLEYIRWDNKPICPRCGCKLFWQSHSRNLKMRARACKDCGMVYNVLSGTMLTHSQIGISKLLKAAYVMTVNPGLGPRELADEMGLGLTAAYRLHERLIQLLKEESTHE